MATWATFWSTCRAVGKLKTDADAKRRGLLPLPVRTNPETVTPCPYNLTAANDSPTAENSENRRYPPAARRSSRNGMHNVKHDALIAAVTVSVWWRNRER